MPERDGKDQGEDRPKQVCLSCWFARHSLNLISQWCELAISSDRFLKKNLNAFNGAPRVWAEKNIYFGHKILMKQPHDCSY